MMCHVHFSGPCRHESGDPGACPAQLVDVFADRVLRQGGTGVAYRKPGVVVGILELIVVDVRFDGPQDGHEVGPHGLVLVVQTSEIGEYVL